MISLSFPPEANGSGAFPFIGKTAPSLRKIVHTYDNPHWFYSHHAHSDLTELIYVSGGAGIYTIDDVPYHVCAGDVLAISPNATHAVLSDHACPLDSYNLGIADFQLPGLPKACIVAADVLPRVHVEGSVAQLFESGMQQILSLRQALGGEASCGIAGRGSACDLAGQGAVEGAGAQAEPEGVSAQAALEGDSAHTALGGAACSMIAAALVARAAVLFASAPRKVSARTDPASVLAHDVLVFLSEHYREPITLASLSARFSASASAISHAMTQRYGTSPISHLIDCRLTASLWLLISTDLPVSSVARQVGYANARHFSSLFADRVGISPTAFRAAYRE